MGIAYFEADSAITDEETAFHALVKEAQHGHDGYTGTIAEKSGFTVVTRTPLTERELAVKIRETASVEDFDIEDQWAPALALPIADAKGKLAGWVFYGYAAE